MSVVYLFRCPAKKLDLIGRQSKRKEKQSIINNNLKLLL